MMRKSLVLLALLGLTAPSAAPAQILTGLDGRESDGLEVAVFMRPIRGQSPEAFTLNRLLIDALETSRLLNRVDVPGENTMQIEAPISLTRMANGGVMTVEYEIWPIRGMEQAFSATCPAGQPERCVDSIVQRTERMSRMDSTRR